MLRRVQVAIIKWHVEEFWRPSCRIPDRRRFQLDRLCGEGQQAGRAVVFVLEHEIARALVVGRIGVLDADGELQLVKAIAVWSAIVV